MTSSRDPNEGSDNNGAFPFGSGVGIGIAFGAGLGIILGIVVSALTQNAVWIGIDISLEPALESWSGQYSKRIGCSSPHPRWSRRIR